MNATSPNSTRELLRERLNSHKGEWRVIAEESGLGYSWLSKFADGRITNPTTDKLETLYQYFYGKAA